MLSETSTAESVEQTHLHWSQLVAQMMHINASNPNMLNELLRFRRLRILRVEVLHRFEGQRRRRLKHDIDEVDKSDEDSVEQSV